MIFFRREEGEAELFQIDVSKPLKYLPWALQRHPERRQKHITVATLFTLLRGFFKNRARDIRTQSARAKKLFRATLITQTSLQLPEIILLFAVMSYLSEDKPW